MAQKIFLMLPEMLESMQRRDRLQTDPNLKAELEADRKMEQILKDGERHETADNLVRRYGHNLGQFLRYKSRREFESPDVRNDKQLLAKASDYSAGQQRLPSRNDATGGTPLDSSVFSGFSSPRALGAILPSPIAAETRDTSNDAARWQPHDQQTIFQPILDSVAVGRRNAVRSVLSNTTYHPDILTFDPGDSSIVIDGTKVPGTNIGELALWVTNASAKQRKDPPEHAFEFLEALLKTNPNKNYLDRNKILLLAKDSPVSPVRSILKKTARLSTPSIARSTSTPKQRTPQTPKRKRHGGVQTRATKTSPFASWKGR